MHPNTQNLQAEIDWLEQIIIQSGDNMQEFNDTQCAWSKFAPPVLSSQDSVYGQFTSENELTIEERLVLVLSLCVHLRPGILHPLIMERNKFRLVKTTGNNITPSGETALMLLAGNNLEKRIYYQYIFDTAHVFYRKSVLDLGPVDDGASALDGVLKVNKSYKDLFIHNQYKKPRFSHQFPAHLLTTNLEWDDMILNESALKKLEEIRAFHQYEKELKENLGLVKHIKPGYRCLFYGPSGTGKTLAASLIGKYLKKDVYRVDLSSVVSKYIGETSKNLNNLFNTAEDKGWILFFDEGDALFGKRTDSNESDNKANYYANQDIGFLLQRIENYNGLVIVASNLRKNMDTAFSRRFQVIVLFDIPDPAKRLRLWSENVSPKLPYDPTVNLDVLATRHSLSAASIVNVINRASLLALQRGGTTIKSPELELCIMDEQYK